MQDMRSQLEKLQTGAAECALIRDLATAPKKRELFARLAEHLSGLAGEVERAIGGPIAEDGKSTGFKIRNRSHPAMDRELQWHDSCQITGN